MALAATQEWLQDITRTQLHKFLTGMAPVKRIVKIVSAVSVLLGGGGGGGECGGPMSQQGSGGAAGRAVAVGVSRKNSGTGRLIADASIAVQRTMAGAGRSQMLAQVIPL